MRDWWRRVLTRELARLRHGGRGGLLWSMRVTAAATASYVVATLIFEGAQPLLAPLTAMLVVQVTPVSLLTSGLDRVVAVVSGVSLAVLFSARVPLQWWSLGLLIFVAITIGQALRLRSNLVEVAISGMLVLGVGTLGAAEQRIGETLVGAAVGIAANLLFPPKVTTLDAGEAINGLADRVSDLLDRAADELSDLVTRGADVAPATRAWLGDARRITHDIPLVGQALLRAEEGRRLNVRAVGTPNVGPGLRQGLEALEHSAVAVRSMFRAVVDAAQDPAGLSPERGDGADGAADDVLLGLAHTFREMAACVDAFGQLVRDEADPATRLTPGDVETVRDALEGLREARARLDDQLTAGGSPALLELHASVLSTVKRLLGELDLDERVRRQVRQPRPARPRMRRPQPRSPGDAPPTSQEPRQDDETQLLPTDERRRRGRHRP